MLGFGGSGWLAARQLEPVRDRVRVLRAHSQPSLWETLLPAQALRMPPVLTAVDVLLDDPAFIVPFEAHFHPTGGRPSTPIETYLRLMFLKYWLDVGFEPLVDLVRDSITFRRFARIGLVDTVPHPTTLMKITTRCGPETVAELNAVLIVRAVDDNDEEDALRVGEVRGDTTVVEADVAYPTDSGLLAKAIRRIAMAVAGMQAAGGARRTHVRDRSRAAGRRARSIAANLSRRSGEAKEAVKQITEELADLAVMAVSDAKRALVNARRTLARRGGTGRLRRAVDDLDVLLERTGRIEQQTRLRLSGVTPPGASRLVSLHDPDARPIVKGRLGKPVEFGFKAQVVDNVDGIVLDYQVHVGNPPDGPMLAPAVERIIALTGQKPTAVTADRGYGEVDTLTDVAALGIDRVAIPKKGRPSRDRQAYEHTRWFRRLIKWRTGVEGRISCLKRDFSWARTRIDGIDGAQIWCGYGVLHHNLVKLATV